MVRPFTGATCRLVSAGTLPIWVIRHREENVPAHRRRRSAGQHAQQESQLIVDVVALVHRLADLGTQGLAEPAARPTEGRAMRGIAQVPGVRSAVGRRRHRRRGGQKRTELPESVCLAAGRVVGLDPSSARSVRLSAQ